MSLKILWQASCMPLGHPSLRRNIHRGFLRFLGFNSVFKEDAIEFLKKARENPEWVEDKFISSQIERLNRGEVAAATYPIY